MHVRLRFLEVIQWRLTVALGALALDCFRIRLKCGLFDDLSLLLIRQVWHLIVHIWTLYFLLAMAE